MQNITFTAQKEQQELIDALIQAGEFRTKDKAINAAIKLLEGQGNAKLQRLRRLIDEGDNSGPAVIVDEDKLLEELRREP